MSNVLILGCGAREHAIAWKLSASPNVKNVFLAPGNACMYSISGNRKLNSVEEVREFCIENSVFLTVIGPEKEICEGWADELSDICLVFAPNKFCAMLEGSKNFAKNFMIENCLPTAEFQSFDDLKDALNFINEITWKKIVIKEDGLCSGKGVTIATTKNEAKEKLEEIFNYNKKNSSVVIEEFLDGFEVSAMCFTDGFFISRLPLSQDHKKIFEGDLGENTGGMGAIAPLVLPKSIDDKITAILQITIDALRARGLLYKGILYAGLMVKADDVYILEYNCRFGDPECEVVLRLLESDLFDILKSCCDETLYNCNIRWSKKHAIGIVMATKGYPQSFVTDKIVSSSLLLNESKILNNKDNVVVFYAGLKKNELKEFVNCGGRVLCVTSVNNNPYTAKLDCLKALDNIHFDLKYFRRDIGHSILFPPKPPLNYCNSGVNVAEGNRFVEEIKEFCKLTLKAGTEQIGGFGAVVDLKMAGFKNPQLVIGMDGVGTKLDIASQINLFDYLGHDLVGMCVNDVLCHASKPVAFLDYYVTGKLNLYNSKKIIKSIANACLESGCSLIGGETAEMPGVYNSNQWDIAGCCIGVRESDWSYLPQLKEIKAGNVLLGLASNGLHSNGFSLVRKILTENNFQLNDNCLWNNNSTLGAELLKPTKIYVKDIFELSVSGKLKAIAHITGGGIIENLPRCLPKNLAAKIVYFFFFFF